MPRRFAYRPRPGRAAVAALTALLALTMSSSPAAADGETPGTSPEVNDATILAAKVYPGVQLIATTYTATVSVAVPVINQDAVVVLAQRLARQALSGGFDATEEAITEEIVDAIVKSPNTYFVASSRVYRRRSSLVGVGTGWAITPDGYIITAAHVVDSPEDELRTEFANSTLIKLGRQFVRGLRNSGTALTNDQVNRLTDAILGWLAAHMSVDRLQVSVAADLALNVAGVGKDQKPVEAEVVDKGTPYPGSDVALLKIDGQEHLPTIDVGSNDDVSPGATVHVVGFPAASTFSPGLSRDAQVQPTVTEGPVTAIKSTGSGMPVFQTQAPASPGNSGGPVVTDNGASVGVLVANAVGSDGVAAQGQNFVIPASEITDMLERNGVEPEQSDTTKTYSQAVDAFYQEHYSEALPLFEKVETLYPAHPFAPKFITDSKTAIDEGLDQTPTTSGVVKPLLIAGSVALLLALIGLGTWLLLRSRRNGSRRRTPEVPAYAAAPQGGGFPPAGYPAYPGPGGYPNRPPQPYPGQPQPYHGQPQPHRDPQGQYPAWAPAPPPGYPYPHQPMAPYPAAAGTAPDSAWDAPSAVGLEDPEPYVFDQPVHDGDVPPEDYDSEPDPRDRF